MSENIFSNICKNLKNRFILGKENYNECKELIKDIKDSFNMNDIKLDIISSDNVVISAKKSLSEYPNLSVNLDFKKNRMIQKEAHKGFVLMPYLPNKKVCTTINGTIDGVIKTVKEVEKRSDKMGNYREVTTFEDRMTGNNYKRIKTPEKTEYFKYIGGEYRNLFPKI